MPLVKDACLVVLLTCRNIEKGLAKAEDKEDFRPRWSKSDLGGTRSGVGSYPGHLDEAASFGFEAKEGGRR